MLADARIVHRVGTVKAAILCIELPLAQRSRCRAASLSLGDDELKKRVEI